MDTVPDPDLEIKGVRVIQTWECPVSFKCECNVIIQIQYTKNLNPGRFELGTTLS